MLPERIRLHKTNPGELTGDLILDLVQHQYDGPWWDGRRAQFERIEVPLFSSANWGAELQVEIWPIGILFEEGSRLRLDFAPRARDHYAGNYQIGENTIYLGGSRASHLLPPIIP